MKVSIITTVYNNKNEIGQAIDSVLKQNYGNIEYIVIDGGSTDGTLDVIKSYGNKISRLISEPDNCIYDALNKGIALATGDIIGFLHSDDIFENEHIIAIIVNCFANNNISGTYGDLLYVSKNNPEKIIRYWKSCDFNSNLLKKGWMPPHPTLFLRKEIYQNFGNFNTAYKIAADYDFMLRVLSKPENAFVYIPIVITRMRVGGNSNKSIKNIIRKSREDYSALKKNNIGGLLTLLMKNISKVEQFFKK